MIEFMILVFFEELNKILLLFTGLPMISHSRNHLMFYSPKYFPNTMHFATLGYGSNPLIQQYRSAFLQKLENFWRTQIGGEIPSADFLLLPDIHSRLLSHIRPIQ